ncbi:MAG: Glucans biosynthesis protein [Planctomycetota bacterium]
MTSERGSGAGGLPLGEGHAEGGRTRRSDLDALRGFAMLLGIAVHASVAYFSCPWPVQDPRQSGWLALGFGVVHGFRMPLFFLLSGFFTMLVRQRRGLRELLRQRALRILLPLAIACLTILPLDRVVMAWTMGISPGSIFEPLPMPTDTNPPEPGLRQRPLDSIAGSYRRWLESPVRVVDIGGHRVQVFTTDVFDHLWFLWYLCWLVAAFAVAEVIGFGPTGPNRWWLVPASCLPYVGMQTYFGPETALGLLPAPHLLLYYGCFFWFGAASYAADGPGTLLGRRWPFVLPLSLLVILPAGLATMGDRALASTLQPAYAWGMSLGLIGLFHRFCSRPSDRVRWLSDASYWMYLIHLPVVIVFQALLRGLPWPAGWKFLAALTATVVVSLVSYQWCVRYTLIGRVLNGPRSPRGSTG